MSKRKNRRAGRRIASDQTARISNAQITQARNDASKLVREALEDIGKTAVHEIPVFNPYREPWSKVRESAHLYLFSRRHRFAHDPLEKMINRRLSSREKVFSFESDIYGQLLSLRHDLALLGPLCFAGQVGTSELEIVYSRLHEMCKTIVDRRSISDWMAITRRIHYLHLDYTDFAPRWFLESLSRESSNHDVVSDLNAIVLHPDESVLDDCHRLLMVVTAMWQIGRAYRSVAKGLLTADLIGPTLVPLGVSPNPEIGSSVLLYDARGFMGVGTETGEQGSSRSLEASQDMVAIADAVIPGWINRADMRRRRPRRMLHLTSCIPEVLSRSAVFSPFEGCQPPSMEAIGAAAILWTSHYAIQKGRSHRFAPRGSWLAWGYIDLFSEDVRKGLERWSRLANDYRADWTIDGALRSLTTSSEGKWVSEQPAVLAEVGGIYRFDLVFATRCLYQAVPRALEGSEANLWAKEFESEVQMVIDQSSWRPPDDLRFLIGKTIRRSGSDITDIDAVGYYEGRLLLVDAKAWITKPDLDHGDFGTVRNYREAAESADRSWRSKIEMFTADPSLLGPNVPNDVVILGVVVCPDVPYVHIGPCTEVIFSNMRAVGTIKELEVALRSGN
jgi:hypothetical protein